MTEPSKPSTDLPFAAAINELTGFEQIAIEKRFNRQLHELGGLALYATVWAFENRDGNRRSWESVLGLSTKDAHGYFAEEPSDVDPDDPDTELGKGSGSGG